MQMLLLSALLSAFATSTGPRTVREDEAVAEFAERGGEVRVLDVRTAREYEAGHLDGAELLDLMSPDFRERLEALPRDVPYRLYCRSGNRSGQATRLMAELGFSDVANIGGFRRLVDAGAPVAE